MCIPEHDFRIPFSKYTFYNSEKTYLGQNSIRGVQNHQFKRNWLKIVFLGIFTNSEIRWFCSRIRYFQNFENILKYSKYSPRELFKNIYIDIYWMNIVVVKGISATHGTQVYPVKSEISNQRSQNWDFKSEISYLRSNRRSKLEIEISNR